MCLTVGVVGAVCNAPGDDRRGEADDLAVYAVLLPNQVVVLRHVSVQSQFWNSCILTLVKYQKIVMYSDSYRFNLQICSYLCLKWPLTRGNVFTLRMI